MRAAVLALTALAVVAAVPSIPSSYQLTANFTAGGADGTTRGSIIKAVYVRRCRCDLGPSPMRWCCLGAVGAHRVCVV